MRQEHRTPRPDPAFVALCRDVVELYATIVEGKKPADFVFSTYFRSRSIRDHALRGRIAEAVYATLRRAPYYNAVVAGAPGASARDAVRLTPFLGAVERRDATPATLVGAYSEVTGVRADSLASLVRWFDEHRDLDTLPEASLERFAARHAFPAWVVDEIASEASRDEIGPLLDGLNAAPPLCVRVNTLEASVDDVERALRSEGFETRHGRLSPHALFVERNHDLFTSATFRRGLVEVQDEGSQVVSLLVDPKPKGRVLDLCAGSGGKTLHLGALMRGRGEVFAYDTDVRRLSNMTRRLRRSGLQNVRVLHDADAFTEFESRFGGKLDRILVDAPCSGLGTVRRAPDIKLHATPELVELMIAKQRTVLATAARLVAPGGRIVYATCSILPRENTAIVDDFLADNAAFRLLPLGPLLDSIGGSTDGIKAAVDGRATLSLAPHVHGTDGFFAAVLERVE